MSVNIGRVDRAIRIAIGLAMLAAPLLLDGVGSWVGLLGAFPLATGLARHCPLYRLLGLNTCLVPPPTQSAGGSD